MADLLDAVVDIHDKLHMDVLFNPSRDSSSSSSVTVQSKLIVILIQSYLHDACHGIYNYMITFVRKMRFCSLCVYQIFVVI
jgi:hypothetical protein